MKTLILTLKQKSGLLSDLQSDTIYGHFCWRMAESAGSDVLSEFIELFKIGKPVFLLSDGLVATPEGIKFHKPLVYRKSDVPGSKVGKIQAFVKNKALKEDADLTLDQLNVFLQSGVIPYKVKTESKEKKPAKKPLEQSLRVSVQIDRDSFSSAQGRLFSYKPVHSADDTRFVIFIRVLNDEMFSKYKCASLLKEVFLTGFGKKKSSGYGQFEVDGDIVEYTGFQEPADGNAFIVLGNYLPASEDGVTPIGYEINTKYGKLGEDKSHSENPFKNPIALLTAGSCFSSSVSRDYFGRVTDREEISPSFKEAVQFGMPFFLRFKYQE